MHRLKIAHLSKRRAAGEQQKKVSFRGKSRGNILGPNMSPTVLSMITSGKKTLMIG